MSFLARLSILYPPTCVGFGTGSYIINPRSFSWKCDIIMFSVLSLYKMRICLHLNLVSFYPNPLMDTY
jgi:hypothetical protein